MRARRLREPGMRERIGGDGGIFRRHGIVRRDGYPGHRGPWLSRFGRTGYLKGRLLRFSGTGNLERKIRTLGCGMLS